MTELTRSQIDRLGERLRRGSPSAEDLRLLDQFRDSVAISFMRVMSDIGAFGLNPSGRSRKTTESIVAKLLREKIRLSRMQDIAGCRLLVSNVVEQDEVLSAIERAFGGADVIDRREKPSHGYRAVHVVVEVSKRFVEIQIRTRLQHMWARYSEKAADTINLGLKYGNGPAGWVALLGSFADEVTEIESKERQLLQDLNSLREARIRLQLEKRNLIRKIEAGLLLLDEMKDLK